MTPEGKIRKLVIVSFNTASHYWTSEYCINSKAQMYTKSRAAQDAAAVILIAQQQPDQRAHLPKSHLLKLLGASGAFVQAGRGESCVLIPVAMSPINGLNNQLSSSVRGPVSQHRFKQERSIVVGVCRVLHNHST